VGRTDMRLTGSHKGFRHTATRPSVSPTMEADPHLHLGSFTARSLRQLSRLLLPITSHRLEEHAKPTIFPVGSEVGLSDAATAGTVFFVIPLSAGKCLQALLCITTPFIHVVFDQCTCTATLCYSMSVRFSLVQTIVPARNDGRSTCSYKNFDDAPFLLVFYPCYPYPPPGPSLPSFLPNFFLMYQWFVRLVVMEWVW